MNLFLVVSLLIFAFFILERAVDLFIKSSQKLSNIFHLSGYTVSFLLVALATSLPEIVVSLTSAVHKTPMLAYGNAIGSNIALLTLIAALPGLFKRGLSTKEIFGNKDIYLAILFSLLMVVLGLDYVISKTDGIILIIGYIIYVFSILERDKGINYTKPVQKSNLIVQSVLFFFSIGIILFSSEAIVQGALAIAEKLNMKVVFVGLTITALGTSVPELAYVIKLMSKSRQEEILGDIVGSLVANITLVIGIAAIVKPITIANTLTSSSSLIFLGITYLVFYIFSKTNKRIDRKESLALILLYIIFIVVEFSIKG